MEICDILTESGDSLTTEDGRVIVGENCVGAVIVAAFTPSEGFHLRPLQQSFQMLNGF